MASIPVLSFNSGQLDSKIDVRIDVEKYHSGCKRLENMMPEVYGSVTRRPGLKHIAEQYQTTDTKKRLMSYIYLSDQSMIVEFGDYYAVPITQVYHNGQPVVQDGKKVYLYGQAVESPYSQDDLELVQQCQHGGTKWLVHPRYPPYKMKKGIGQNIILEQIDFRATPFLTRNDLVEPGNSNTAYMTIASEYACKEEGGSTGAGIGYGDAGNTYGRGQVIYFEHRTKIISVQIPLYRTEGQTGTFTVSFRLASTRSLTTAIPAGDDINNATASINITDVTTGSSGQWYTFTLSDPVTVEKGQYVCLIGIASGMTKNEALYWFGNTFAGDGALRYTSGEWLNWSPTEQNYRISGEILSVTGGTYVPGTMTCQDLEENPINYFEDSHVGAMFKLTFPRKYTKLEGKLTGTNTGVITDTTTGIESIPIKGSFKFNTHGNWSGTVVLQRRENSSSDDEWEDFRTYVSEVVNGAGDRNVQAAFREESDGVEYRILVTEHNSGTIRADITVDNSTEDTIVKVTSLVSASEANILIVSGSIVAVPTRRWAEGAWSPLRGYPVGVTFFEDRCCYVGNKVIQDQVTPDYMIGPHNEPTVPAVWLSATGDYDNFMEGVSDSNSFGLTISSTEPARWIVNLDKLFVATGSEEWVIQSNKLDTVLTPTNATVKKHSSYGASPVQPVALIDCFVYVDKTGRCVRRIKYGDENAKDNLSILAQDMITDQISWMTAQRKEVDILWVGLSDGTLLSMTYDAEQKMVAWSRHPLQTDAVVLHGCSTSGQSDDELWLCVQRTISSTAHIYLEKLESWDFGTDIENCFYVDCGLTYNGPSTSSITGLSYLEGKTVKILGDGVEMDQATVTSGAITTKIDGVTTPVTKAHVGLSYTSILQPMRVVVQLPRATSMGSYVNIPAMTINFTRTMGAQFGTTQDNLQDIDWNNPEWKNFSNIEGLFDGEVVVSVPGGFSLDAPIIISQQAPLPVTVKSIIPRIEKVGD